MKLSEVKDVVIKLDPGYSIKFIVAKLTDKNGHKKDVVRTDTSDDAHMACHSYIYDKLERELWKKISVYVLGGGYIRVNLKQKLIELFDKSNDYGKEPNRAQTVQMIQVAYPDYQVTAV